MLWKVAEIIEHLLLCPHLSGTDSTQSLSLDDLRWCNLDPVPTKMATDDDTHLVLGIEDPDWVPNHIQMGLSTDGGTLK